MRTRNLTRHATAWAHPYTRGPLASAVFYADGGEGDGKAAAGDGGTDGDGKQVDYAAEAEKWKALARKHEANAKVNAAAAKERDELKRQGMSDAERLVEEATAKARGEERSRLSGLLARQGFIAAAAGRITNAADVAADLNLTRYVGEDGEVDEKGLAELVNRLAPAKSGGDSGQQRGFDQGARGGSQSSRTTDSVEAGADLYAQRHKKTT